MLLSLTGGATKPNSTLKDAVKDDEFQGFTFVGQNVLEETEPSEF